MAFIGDGSRYLFCQGIRDDQGRLLLTDRIPYTFVERADNRQHTVTEGDTLFGLADLYFRPMQRPAQLFWVIADFNGITDATLKLSPGSVLQIPSVRLIVEEIFNESRRIDFGA